MAKTKQKSRAATETDSTYFLKLVIYLILGSQWFFIVNPEHTTQIPLPVGFIIGLLFTTHEHFKIDRKIEYAILLVAMFIGFWSHIGLLITIN